MPEAPRKRRKPLPPWGETLFALIVGVLLGGAMAGAVWTRIEEFETGEWSGSAIVQTIVLGLVLIALVIGLWRYLSKRVQD